MQSFKELPLSESVLKNLESLGFEAPTPIQAETIPLLLAGRDVIGQAATGTGKTAAFGIPFAETISGPGVQALVLCPTRELALQVTEELNRFGMDTGMRAFAVYGGAAMGPQVKALTGGRVNVVVGTPGRIIDHLERGTFTPDQVRILVLDEADEMLNMGFLEEIEVVLQRIPEDRQTLLMSATMPEPIARLARRYLRDPETVKVMGRQVAADLITQHLVYVQNHEKLDALLRIIAVEDPTAVLVFRETREGVDELVAQLARVGQAVEGLHGGLSQHDREAVVGRLREGKTRFVVATAVAARGLDVDRITHVVNYDAPAESESYVHRIGRTGRAGREGKAYLFITPRENRRLREIEYTLRQRIQVYELPENDAVHEAIERRLQAWIAEEATKVPEASPEALAIVDRLMADGVDVRYLAAAALKEAAKAAGHVAPPLAPQAPRPQRRDVRHEQGNRQPGAPRESVGPKAVVRVTIGLRDSVRPADLVGAIANEAGVSGRDIGRITLDRDVSYVEVPGDRLEDILSAMEGKSIRGVAVTVTQVDAAPQKDRKPFHPRPRQHQGGGWGKKQAYNRRY